jgi:hypothetical protein
MSIESTALDLYKEQTVQGRHLESQRLEVTKFVLTAAAALLSVMGALKFSIHTAPLAAAMMLLGVLGRRVTKVLVERFDRHMKRARAFRALVDGQLGNVIAPVVSSTPLVGPSGGGRQRIRDFWIDAHTVVIWIGIVSLVLVVGASYARGKHQIGSPWKKLLDQVAFQDGSVSSQRP